MAKKFAVKMKVLILWESEIRAAAIALKLLAKAPKDASSEDIGKLARTALTACNAALYGADDENSLLILSKPDNIFTPV